MIWICVNYYLQKHPTTVRHLNLNHLRKKYISPVHTRCVTAFRLASKCVSSLHSSKKRASSRPFKPTNQNYWHHNTRHTVAYRQSAIKSHFPQGRCSIPFQNTGGASFPHACYTDFKDRISRHRHACDTTQHAVCAAPFLMLHSHAQAHSAGEAVQSFPGWQQPQVAGHMTL